MVCQGFHYMNERIWDELKDTSNTSQAIQPQSLLVKIWSIADQGIPKLPSWAHEHYIFAFPDKEAPEPWKGYSHWKDEWEILTGDIGEKIVGLKFDILPSDDAYVVDWAHRADYRRGYNNDRKDALRKYTYSRVPANEYDGSFRMPELIIKNPIELDRLVLHTKFTREIVRKNGKWTIEYKSMN